MNKSTLTLTLFIAMAPFIFSTNALASQRFILELLPLKNGDSTHRDAIKQLVLECFLNNGNFMLKDSDCETKGIPQSNKPERKTDFYITIFVRTAKMEKVKATAYNYYSKETTYTDCFNFVLGFDLQLTDAVSGIPLFIKSFEYEHKGPFEPAFIAETEAKAKNRTLSLLMASLFTFINFEMGSVEQIENRAIAARSGFVTEIAIAIR